MDYQKFKYDQSEWDNIATVVPRFLIYLEKYVSGISAKCHEFNEREHIDHLREDFQDQVDRTNDDVTRNRDDDLQEKSEINLKASILKRNHDNLRTDFQTYRERLTLKQGNRKMFLQSMLQYMKEKEGHEEFSDGEISDDGT